MGLMWEIINKTESIIGSGLSNSYIHLSASFKNPWNVLYTLDFGTSQTQQPIAFGGLCPSDPCFGDPLCN